MKIDFFFGNRKDLMMRNSEKLYFSSLINSSLPIRRKIALKIAP